MANKGSSLSAGEFLQVGDYLISDNGQFVAAMQDNADLGLYYGTHTTPPEPDWTRPFWSVVGESGNQHLVNSSWHFNAGQGGGKYFAIMQSDGNFVLYLGGDPQHAGAPYWASNTNKGQGQYTLIMQNDGNLVLYHQGSPLWASGTNWAASRVTAHSSLQNGQFLEVNDYLVSDNGQYFAVMQGDGNFVLYFATATMSPGPDWKRPFWATSTGHSGGCFAVMQSDGNFVLYAGRDPQHAGAAYWASNTNKGSGQYSLTMQDDGNLVLYHQADPTHASAALWASNTYNPLRLTQIKAQMNGFDTVVAVTQKAINTQLKGLFWVKDALQKQWVIQATDADGNVYGTMTATINAPKITINTQQFQPHTVLFTIPFKSGTLQRWKGFGPSATQVTTPFGAGDLAFGVNLDLQDADSANVPDQVKSAIASIKNLGPGMFSVRQLLLDLENANLAEYDRQFTTLPPEIVGDEALQVGLQQTFARLHQQGGNILGYSIRVNNPNDVNPETPSFPPTDLNFATHVSSFSSTGSDLDTLDYLVMTQHRPLPTTALPAGDFVVDPSANGTMAIARSVFFDNYLLPKIASCTNITFNLNVHGDEPGMGINPQASMPFTQAGSTWVYETSKDGTASYNLNGVSPTDHYYKVSHTCTVTIPPGSNTVVITGVTTGYSHVKTWWGSKADWLSSVTLTSTFDQTGTINWNITITFSPSGTGDQLIGTVTSSIPAMNITSGGNDLGKFDQGFMAAFHQRYNDFSQQLSTMLTNMNLNQIVKNLTTALSDHRNYFVFPGADSFFFKDPCFNNEGDLLVTVTYNFY